MAVRVKREKYDRAFLESMLDSYLEALVAHDPARLPLAKKVKFTENAQVIPVGEGLWATASENATYRLYACDTKAGQIGFFGQMKENGFPILLSARLKIAGGLITEIETVVVRSVDSPWTLPERSQPRQVFQEVLSPAERVSREEMVKITDLYFEGLVRDNGDIVPFDEQCNRIENGLQTTNNPSLRLPGSSNNPPVLGCREQINAKTFAYITEVDPRRCTVVDEERGLTFGTFMFHHSGTIKSVIVPGIGEREMMPAARRPFTVVVSELFKIQNGKIRDIEAIMTSLPYHSGSGWDDQAANRHDRSYLEGMIDRYFEALSAHDPSRLPLSPRVKFTENTIALKPGEGLWATASDRPAYKQTFADTVGGQAGCFAVLKENGFPILMALRFKEENRLITEIETIVVRPQGSDPKAFASLTQPNPVFSEVLAPSERSSRQRMIELADLYFDGIQNDTGDFVQFDDECHRMENGMITANNPNPGPASNPLSVLSAMKCIDQFKRKTFYFITKIHPRRYLVVDEERGLVLCNAMFVHAGNILEAEIEGRGKVATPAFALRPSNVLVSELFKIKNGKIREIEVVGTMFPYGIKSGW